MTSTIAWTTVITAILLLAMDRIPWLRLRLRADEEELGTDEAQIGEFTYQEDTTYIPVPIRSHISAKNGKITHIIDDQIVPSELSSKPSENGPSVVNTNVSNEKLTV